MIDDFNAITEEQIVSVDKFSYKTAAKVLAGMAEHAELFNKIQSIIGFKQQVTSGDRFTGEKIVITGFRDAALEVLAVCFETSLLARELIENTILADDIQNNTEKIALQLSEPLPPTYNGIIAGLNNAVAMRGTANVESPSRASTDLRAAVIGLWCINDTIAALNQTFRRRLH
ncbi:hypothetical protein [Escherichia coli]|uniref:hypothetical protein n=1 Tax=Escherichia coli TaxID=562 RepID=UPI00208DA6FB|nr:hypothetical protein [Escherichia coli]